MTPLAVVAILTAAAGAMAVWLAVRFAGALKPRASLWITLSVLASYAALLAWRPPGFLLADILVLAAGAFGGFLMARALRTPPGLVAFAITAAIADAISFNRGITRVLIERSHTGKSSLLFDLCISVPVPRLGVTPIMGVGDLFVMAAFMAALQYLGYRRADFFVPAGALVAAVVVGLAVGGVPAVPMLSGAVIVFMAVARWTGYRAVPRSA
jgi:hypothetical protein